MGAISCNKTGLDGCVGGRGDEALKSATNKLLIQPENPFHHQQQQDPKLRGAEKMYMHKSFCCFLPHSLSFPLQVHNSSNGGVEQSLDLKKANNTKSLTLLLPAERFRRRRRRRRR